MRLWPGFYEFANISWCELKDNFASRLRSLGNDRGGKCECQMGRTYEMRNTATAWAKHMNCGAESPDDEFGIFSQNKLQNLCNIQGSFNSKLIRHAVFICSSSLMSLSLIQRKRTCPNLRHHAGIYLVELRTTTWASIRIIGLYRET
jgi:hypothetical protein